MMGFMGMGNNPMVFAVGIFLFMEIQSLSFPVVEKA